jgi:hypothetical protein
VLSVKNTTPLPCSTVSTSTTVTCTNTPTDPARDRRTVLKQLDAIAAELRPRPRTGKAVDAFT